MYAVSGDESSLARILANDDRSSQRGPLNLIFQPPPGLRPVPPHSLLTWRRTGVSPLAIPPFFPPSASPYFPSLSFRRQGRAFLSSINNPRTFSRDSTGAPWMEDCSMALFSPPSKADKLFLRRFFILAWRVKGQRRGRRGEWDWRRTSSDYF